MRSSNRRSLLALLFLPLCLYASGCGEPDPNSPEDTTGSGSADSGSTDQIPQGPAVLFADSNRDGHVDLQGDSDLADKMNADPNKGALFLANLDDDSRRCNAGPTVATMTCFDAADEIINGPEDAKDLALVKTRPLQVSDGATATLAVSQGPASQIRVFEQLPDGSHRVIGPETRFDANKLRQGLTFAIEGKDIARDKSVWDGSIQLRLVWEDQGQRLADTVAMRVAPILTHSHLDPVEQLIASPTTHAVTASFRRDLEQALVDAGQAAPLYLNPDPLDLWTQDYFEPFFAAIPGPSGPVSMRVLLRSNQQRKESHLTLLTLLGPDVAVTGVSLKPDPEDTGTLRGGTYDGFGNLETLPPLPGFPVGRQIVGGSMDKEMGPSKATMALLEAQGSQAPIWLDTAWLAVGHVDEFISFVPSPDAKLGFKVLVSDPVGTLNLLKKANQEGHGATPMLSYVPTLPEEKQAFEEAQVKNPTIEAFLAQQDTEKNQLTAQTHIDANLEILRSTIGLTDADIVKIPGLYQVPDFGGIGDLGFSAATSQYKLGFSKLQQARAARSKAARQIDDWADQYGGFFPAAANMVVLPEAKVLLIAKQHGPIINGVDIIERQLTSVVSALGYTPHYVDDFLSYHLGEGDVHCGTNTLRSLRTQWWMP